MKKLEFNKTNFYKKNNQWIIGVTVNKENECYRNGDSCKKYELNFWLGLVGFHITVRNKVR